MSIVAISGLSSNLYRYLQSLSSEAQANTTASQAVGAIDSVGDSLNPGSTQSTANTLIGQDTSSANSGFPSLVQQLETAIQDSIDGLNTSQSNNPQAMLSAIEQAIQTTLRSNGIDPSQLSQTGHQRHGLDGGGVGNVSANLGANGGSSSKSVDPSASSNPIAITQTPGLEWLLSQLNIDAHQFRNDIISALSGSQNGNLDQSQVFQSFPTGQNVNVS